MGRDGKPTREKILTESRQLIYENGFSGTSVDQILAKTGITKGAFFYHFKTKSDLALALMQQFAKSDMEEMNKVLKETTEFENKPRARLLAFIQTFIDMFSNIEEPPNCLYASVSNEQNQYNEETKRIVHDTMLNWRKTFEEMIENVFSVRKPKIEVDKTALADHFNVVIEGAFIVSKAIDDPKVTAAQLKQLKNYFELLFDE